MLEDVKEKWSSKINTVTIGEKKKISVGGETTLPYLHFEGTIPNKPVIALEVLDAPLIDDWADELKAQYKDCFSDVAKWAAKCAEYGADLISLRLLSAHPDNGNMAVDDVCKKVKDVMSAVDIPLIIWGCYDIEKDNLLIPKVSEICSGKKYLLGSARQENYKTITAACLADGHNLITESPLDINIAKQVNILVSEMGFDLNKVVMFPTTGALGYGMEYAYSIQERGFIAALSGDKMLSMPILCDIGAEAWKCKEAKGTEKEFPGWGNEIERGIMWEVMTAISLLIAGGDILVVRHPKALQIIKDIIQQLMK